MRYLYFNTAANTHKMFTVDAFLGGFPTSDTNLRLFFENSTSANALPNTTSYIIDLTVNSNSHKNALDAIYDAILTSENAMIVVADDENSIYIDASITAAAHTDSQTYGFNIGWNGHDDVIKIIPSDFSAADNGRPVMINDASIGSDELFLFSDGANDMYATIAVPNGFKATSVQIYGSDTGQNFFVYSADIRNKNITDIGTGATAIESTCTLATEFVSSNHNYIIIRVTSDGSSDEIHGGRVVISPNLV